MPKIIRVRVLRDAHEGKVTRVWTEEATQRPAKTVRRAATTASCRRRSPRSQARAERQRCS
jgi:hypothetical protein